MLAHLPTQTPVPPPKPIFHGSKPPERSLPELPTSVTASVPIPVPENSTSEAQASLNETQPKLTTTSYESNNEEIYRSQAEPVPLVASTPKYASIEEHSVNRLNSNETFSLEETESSGLRRKELPSVPVRGGKHVYREVDQGITPDDEAGLLSEEEVDLENSDGMSFARVQSVQLQQVTSHHINADTDVASDSDAQPHTHTHSLPQPNPNPSKYGTLGHTRSTKPLPKPRTTSGTLELTQSELKLAYFQVNSLQNQLTMQQNELEHMKIEIDRYKRDNSALVQKTHMMTETELALRDELAELRETIDLLNIENSRLSQEKEKLLAENEQRMLALDRQTSYLKAELIKSATFADSAVKQILMGATNVNQVAACLNGLGKMDI